MKDWLKELSKTCLNLIAVTVLIFFYGAITHPDWQRIYGLYGAFLIVFFIALSYYLWRKSIK